MATFQNRYTDDVIVVTADVLIAYYENQPDWVEIPDTPTPGLLPYQRIGTQIQLKGTDTAGWAASSYIPAPREPVVNYQTGDVRIGDGVNVWASLPSTVGGGGGGAALTSWVTQILPLSDLPVWYAQTTLANAKTQLGIPSSFLALGSTSSTAKAGDWHEDYSTLANKPAVIAAGASQAAARLAIGFDAAVDARALPYDSVSWDHTAGAWVGPGNARPTLPAWVPAKYWARLWVEATIPTGAYAFVTGDMVWWHPSSTLWP